MSDGIESRTGPDSDGEGSGVLGNLPRTRPQRASARRTAARRSAAKTGTSTASGRSADGDGGARSASPSGADAPAGAKTPGRTTAKNAGATRRAPQRTSRQRPGKRAAGSTRRQKRSVTRLDAVPAQGYEPEDDAATGAVRPPGGAELAISAAEIVGELAKAGFSRSERMIRDVLSHLPL